MSFICPCRNKNQPKAIYPKGTSHHYLGLGIRSQGFGFSQCSTRQLPSPGVAVSRVWREGHERLGPSHVLILLVLGTPKEPQNITRLRFAYPLRCRAYWIEYLRLLLLMCSYCGVEVTESSTNKVRTLSRRCLRYTNVYCYCLYSVYWWWWLLFVFAETKNIFVDILDLVH